MQFAAVHEFREWPISTDAALQADVGFRGTAEVLERDRDKVARYAALARVTFSTYQRQRAH